MHLSDIVVRMKDEPSPIRQIMKMASKQNIINMGLDPDDIISYGGGWVGHHPPEGLRSEYSTLSNNIEKFYDAGKYSPTLGFDECREALLSFEKTLFDVQLEINNIIIGNSSTQLTHDLFVALANPGDNVLLFDPTYANYPGQIKMTVPNAQIVRQTVLDIENWIFKDDEALITSFQEIHSSYKPRMTIIPAPDNPSSQVFGESFVKAISDICSDTQTFMVFDYAYKTQCFISYPSYFKWNPNDYPHMIAIHSNSKWARGLGRRLGWIDANETIVDALERIQQRSILCPDTFHQHVLTTYLNNSIQDGSLKKYLEFTREAYKKAANITVASIQQYLEMPCLIPQGGLYTLMHVGEDGDSFVSRILKNTGVLFIPGKGFGNSLTDAVRISYGPHVENQEKIGVGFKRVADYLNK